MKEQPTSITGQPTRPSGIDLSGATVRVLVIDEDPTTAPAVKHVAVSNHEFVVQHEPDVASALVRSDFQAFDVILVQDTPDGAVEVITTHLAQMQSCVRVIGIAQCADFNNAVSAMQRGAVDYMVRPIDPASAGARIVRAFQLVVNDRRKTRRLEQLKTVCQRMSVSRLDVTTQIDTVCNDLVHAYQDLTDQISHVTAVTEFKAIIQQELDVEDLLRTSLEYILRRIGPTNAAVFLASGSEDFSLGAYVNYDCSKETSEFLLNHLVDVITPLMIEEDRLLRFDTNDDLQRWMGDDAAWLADTDLVSFSCRSDGECLAIFTLWRDVQAPFTPDQYELIKAIAQAFTRQLARVVNIHHRHLPDDVWRDDIDDNPDTLAA